MPNESSTEQRLHELLDQKDAKIEELENLLKSSNSLLEQDPFVWALPGPADDAREDLPVPRLELLYEPETVPSGTVSWHQFRVYYRLVYKHLMGDLHKTVLGETTCRGGAGKPIKSMEARSRPGKIDLPYRDGAHICHDMAHLRMPGFAICGDIIEDLSELAGHPERR